MKELEKEWAKYKYWVMAKSHKSYNDIRQLFKDNQKVDDKEFYEIIHELENQKESVKDEVNAMEHIWGYFKKHATQKEKNDFLFYKEQYLMKQIELNKIKEYLYYLSTKYQEEYLLKSYYFIEQKSVE